MKEGIQNLGLAEKSLRHDTKSMIHKRKNLINWTSSELKPLLCERPCEEDEKPSH